MPIKLPIDLPAYKLFQQEKIFVMHNERADTQDIRPLKIGMINLMPKKIEYENQILRYLSNSPLQVEITFITTKTYVSHNTPKAHLDRFYTYFDEIKDQKFDGFIITGAPVEEMEYEEVAYWEELEEIMEWTKTHVFSTLHICWGAMAGLYYHHKIPKYPLSEKKFGVFEHELLSHDAEITLGLDDEFYAPHSRNAEIKTEDILKAKDLDLLSKSEEAGPLLVQSKDKRQIFITGHLEYDRNTLKEEYFRDKEKGIDINIPKNYFPKDDTSKEPLMKWRASAYIVFANWLNYCIYQNTPYNLEDIH